jgi:hypothetical protein
MKKFSDNFSEIDMQEAMKLAQSDAARQLFALLNSSNQAMVNTALTQAAAGNMDQARQTLQQLLATEQAQQLLRQLQGGSNG